jgi:hypothetical protein
MSHLDFDNVCSTGVLSIGDGCAGIWASGVSILSIAEVFRVTIVLLLSTAFGPSIFVGVAGVP